MPDVRSEGTLVQQNDRIFWFKNDFSGGVELELPQALALFEKTAGRKLTPFESRLLISRPVDGSTHITIVSKLMASADAPPGAVFLNIKPVVVGYVVKHREKASRYSFGDVIGTDRYSDINGNLLGKIAVTRKSEPGLEAPLVDPIDFAGGALAHFAKVGVKAIISGIAAGFEKNMGGVAADELENILANRARIGLEELTAEELEGISGGAARPGGEPRMFSAEQLNKPVPRRPGLPNGRPLDKPERLGVIKVVGALIRVSETAAATPAEIKAAIRAELPTRRVKELVGKLAGWTEIDVLEENAGAYNVMRVLYKVQNDVWAVRLMNMHE